MKRLFLFALMLILTVTASADVRLPSVLSSHMVLQQKTSARLWGWCEPGEKITVKSTWDTLTYQTVGTSEAKWSLQIKTPSAGGPYQIFIKGYNAITLDDVLIGEVWVCSGQSNMEWSVNWGLPYADDAAAATNKNIRFFHIPRTTANHPQEDVKARWAVNSPEEMKRFSAVGYFFGLKLHQDLDVPVGLVNASWGGTPAEVWTPADTLMQQEDLKKAAAQLKPSNGWSVKPGVNYNAMIAPLTNFPIAGVIWYQGESNVGMSDTYVPLMTTMIGSWRKAWQKDFPFYYVQIAPYAGYGNGSSAAFLREAQGQLLTFPQTGMVLTSDLVDNINDIHPKLKKEVALRLANYALSDAYGKKGIAFKSPSYKGMQIEKDKVRIQFYDAEKGLVSKGGAPTEFYVAGADQIFFAAEAKIENNTVVVRSKQVKQPVAVRFGFHNASMPNLFSREGLPVNIFRTDDWKVEIRK